MSRLKDRRFQGLIVTAVCGLALLVACSTDSPTAPLQVPPPPTDGGGGVGTGEAPFITSISPNTGTGAGGTTVEIKGIGFFPPLRVDFAGALAIVQSVSSNGTSIRVKTPPYGGDYDLDACDYIGLLDGERNSPTPVDVTVELAASGGSDSVTEGFNYVPLDTECYESGILDGGGV